MAPGRVQPRQAIAQRELLLPGRVRPQRDEFRRADLIRQLKDLTRAQTASHTRVMGGRHPGSDCTKEKRYATSPVQQ